MPLRLLVACALLLVLAGACADAPAQQSADGLRIVVTTSTLGDVVARLVGDDAQVQALVPRGADAHSYGLSAREATDMRQADLLVINGLGLEEGMTDAIEAARDEGVQTFEATSAIETLPFSGEEGHEDEHEGEEEGAHEEEEQHEHEGQDPHFWLDPTRVGESMVALAAEIAELDDSLSDEEWTARGEQSAAELRELAAEVDEILEVVPAERRLLVTNHDALGYFADAFHFEVVGSILPGGSTLAEASAQDIEELADRIAETGVTAIFVDASGSSRLADAVAEQAGGAVEVGTINTGSLGDPGGPAGTYRDYMISNATVIADLLAPDAGDQG